MGEPVKIYKNGKEQTVYGQAQRDILLADGWGLEAPKAAAETVRIDATDAALKLAEENSIDLTQVKGSGKDGRITVEDVQALLGE